ncbi:amino acid ABC transporter substrate-binding protein (PAAT family) [Herbihabitans rhizosphaerae]|uniref:Amino acid ABC transporter substrate-binding protein (PAAT family) n=1 Tax=Herbihabitans rhizosphaerae TaxID=1872711 RepID=A0A4Q7KG72_9PSEU|nr:ABC transporter substrate-binding protein [Herbihabitans rhizosphaerae]RZS33918.1 amino acid ABC transporter substrate-binding protein (PAAT family) [Herbihabitans rhizosphaerae]
MRRSSWLIVVSLFQALALVGCGLSASTSADPGLTDRPRGRCAPELAASVPAPIRQRGELLVGMVPNSPPMAYHAEDHSIVGFDRDMSQAITDVLCLRANPIPTNLDAIVPGLAAGRFDVVLASLAPTEERRKSADFVTYYNGGQGFLARSDTNFPVRSYLDLCGRAVGVIVGSVQQGQLDEAADTCPKAGRPSWRLSLFPDGTATVLALRSSRIDVLYMSISPTQYVANTSPELFRLAGRYKRSLVAAALKKNSPLSAPVHNAVRALLSDGTYHKILEKWKLQENQLDSTDLLSGRP